MGRVEQCSLKLAEPACSLPECVISTGMFQDTQDAFAERVREIVRPGKTYRVTMQIEEVSGL